METIYKLTDHDKEWIQYLKDNPDKQHPHHLGRVDDNDEIIEACCLGVKQFLVEGMACVVNKQIHCGGSNMLLAEFYVAHHLRGSEGQFLSPFPHKELNRIFISLADMNDHGVPWTEIAEYIENNVDNIFVNYP